MTQDVQGTEILPALPERLKTVMPWDTVNRMLINICKNTKAWILRGKQMSPIQVIYHTIYNTNFYEKNNARFTYLLKLQKSQ